MDIFKLGDKILALLEAVFGFWNNQISLVFAMLGQSPVSFKGGGPWAVIEGIEPVFVAVGSSLVVLFFVIGFCSESIDVKDEMRFESIFRMLIRLGLAEWFVANNVTIMKLSLCYGYTAAWILPEGITPKELEIKEQTEHKYVAIHIDRPFDNPFVTIPGAYHTLNDYMRTNGLVHVENEVIPCFETDGESMDVYIACK